MLGTVKYLAPEQVRGEPVDGRTDIYAWAWCCSSALCARPPFSGDNPAATALARLHQRAAAPVAPAPDHPRRRSSAVILRCLELDPADRYQSADDLRAALLEPSRAARRRRPHRHRAVAAADDVTRAWRTPATPAAAPPSEPPAAGLPPARRRRGLMDPGPSRRRATACGCDRCWPSRWSVARPAGGLPAARPHRRSAIACSAARPPPTSSAPTGLGPDLAAR